MLKFHPLKVVEVRAEAEDAVCLGFEVPLQLREEFRFEAGQHLGIRTQLAGEEVRRTYSIVSAPGDGALRIGVRVHPQGRLSRHLAKHVRVGDTLEVLTPNGSFHTRLDPRHRKTYAAFAAGCGITPVLSLAKATLATEPNSRFLLFYGNRSTARIMLLEELLALKDIRLTRLSLNFLFTREPQEVELLNGRLDDDKVRHLAGVLFDAKRVDEYFLCGPGDMNDNVAAALLSLGASAEHIHSERFAVAERTSAPPAPLIPTLSPEGRGGKHLLPLPPVGEHFPQTLSREDAGEGGGEGLRFTTAGRSEETSAVTVVVDGRRRSFAMPMDGQTVLEAAEQAGLDLPFSCRAGVCSTCRTKLVKGAVEMAANYALEPWEVEAGFVLACQSRPTTPELEIDYDQR